VVTRTEQRLAGIAAIATAVLLTASLVLFKGGPPVSHGGGVRSWYEANAVNVRLSAALWILAMIALVAFAVGLREAMWATMADRGWTVTLFIQGAVVFATVAVVSAAIAWALADQAQAGAISADLAGTVWAVEKTLLRFATWGLTAPLVVVSLILHRHSTMGEIGAVAGLVVAVGLLVPLTWSPAMYAFCAWLAFAGITMTRPVKHESLHPEFTR
jgi:hypothetical protein